MKYIRKIKPSIKQEDQKKLSFLRKFDRVTDTIGTDKEYEYYKNKNLVWINGKAKQGQRYSTFYSFKERDYTELNLLLNQINKKIFKFKHTVAGANVLHNVEEILRGIIYKVDKNEDSECFKANALYKEHVQKYVKEIYEYYLTHPFDERECCYKWMDAYQEMIQKPEFKDFSDLIKKNYLTFNTAFQYVFEYGYSQRTSRTETTPAEFINFVLNTYALSSNSEVGSYRTVPAFIRDGNWSPVVPEKISESMDILSDWYSNDMASKRLNPIERACIMHCEIVRIQAFPDGNHRMARLIANESLVETDFPPVAIPFEARKEYNAATNKAIETHELDDLIDIFYNKIYESAVEMNQCFEKLEQQSKERAK